MIHGHSVLPPGSCVLASLRTLRWWGKPVNYAAQGVLLERQGVSEEGPRDPFCNRHRSLGNGGLSLTAPALLWGIRWPRIPTCWACPVLHRQALPAD